MKVQNLFLSFASMPAVAKVTPLTEMSVLEVLGPLVLVIILIFVLAWLVKKINPTQGGCGKDITILSSIPVLGNARLCLIRVGAKDILVGVTSQQVTHIQTFSKPVIGQIPEFEGNEPS